MRPPLAFLLRCLIAIAAVSSPSWADDLPEIYQPDPREKDPWADVALRIESLKCDAQSQCIIRARGLHGGERVGLEFIVGVVEGKRWGVAYRSIGPESDRFVRALATLYRTGSNASGMKQSISADAVILGGSARTLQSKRTDIKIFFNANGPESRYAELYTNIDPVAHVLEIHEKDPEYRQNVIKALAAEWAKAAR